MTDPMVSMIEEAFRAPIQGWDFSWLRGRAEETHPPWDYAAFVRAAAADARRVLDIDTGGGEFLERLGPLPGAVVATEGYTPNVALARKRLGSLRIPLVHAESAPDNVDQAAAGPTVSRSPLPFVSDAFDLVIDRHSSYWPSEVRRVLADGGRFLTQQRSEAGISGIAWEDLFGRSPHPHRRFDLPFATGQLVDAGFEIERADEADTPMMFSDLAAVVYYLRLVPWAVEGFDPVGDRDALSRINERIHADGELWVRGSHMLIDAVARSRGR
jgi:SAM-dependent methyltransferase